MINTRYILLFLFFSSLSFGQENDSHNHHDHDYEIYFTENKGQWNKNALYKLNLKDGALFLEEDGLNYSFMDKSFIHAVHSDNAPKSLPKKIKCHGLKMQFLNNGKKPIITSQDKTSFYENFFVGDNSHWASNVHSYEKINYANLFNNIDFTIYESHGNLKYDFIVHPGGKIKNIKFTYTGAENIRLDNGLLRIKTSIVEVVENKPFAYQIINNEKRKVECEFILNGNVVGFKFPNGYDKQYDLIIDPVLVFSSYSGSTSDNFGFTATYDNNGFTYAGGIAFGVGYPTTTGAYDITYNGGTNSFFGPHTDISISKFNANGSGLIYSTYIGGNRSEAPHSIVTNNAGELFIFGTTGSSNFPITTGAYDASFGGGTNIYPGGAGMEHPSGTDIYVTKLSSNGTALLGSTFVGGTANDGLNTVVALEYNYGDAFRGEITVDNTGNCLIATTTNSSNFPVTNGTTFGGGTSDGVIFKLNNNLTNMVWSSYIGGSSDDAAYGVQLDASGNVFVTGGSLSNNLSNSANTSNGGVDGYIRKYSPTGAIINSRYIGTASYDQTYLVQVDINDDVYVVGQSTGSMPITPGKYNNPNSGQFIQKYDNALTALTYSTVIGRGSGAVDISPSAFLVNDCGLIYLSGWGGVANKPSSSSTTGLPITGNAYQSTTDGSDFYLMVLDKDAIGLLYGTFFGGATSREHVDGGTSRFDKDGNVYQAVCAGCGGNSDFPTTTGAWSNTNNSSNCNLAVFKFNVDVIRASASTPQAYYCWPNPVSFNNLSSGGNTYHWDFGDGDTSNLFSPTHSYLSSGTYTVTLIVSDSTGCILPDTASIVIDLYSPVYADVTPDTGICPGGNVQLIASGGSTYVWSPATGLSATNIPNPIASPSTNTLYQVIVTDTCGSDTGYVNVVIYPVNTSATGDTLICTGETVPIQAFGGATYAWSPIIGLANPNSGSTNATPPTSTNYQVAITTIDGCVATDSVYIEVDNGLPNPIVPNDTAMCNGEVMTLIVSGAREYLWSPNYYITNIITPNVSVNPPQTTKYYIDFTNACGTIQDSILISIVKPTATISPSDTICFNDTFLLWAGGGNAYSWQPNSNLFTPNNDSTYGYGGVQGIYSVIVTDIYGCRDTAYTNIYHYPIPIVDAGPDQIINFGEEVTLSPSYSPGVFFWNFDPYLSCTNCDNPTVTPPTTTIYTANIINEYGCHVTDQVTIFVDGVIYIPNTFTPNGDGVNDIFRVEARDLTKFHLMIFNRWGQLIFETNDTEEGWDGQFKGLPSQIDTYVWRIVYSDVDTFNKKVIGHVNLIR